MGIELTRSQSARLGRVLKQAQQKSEAASPAACGSGSLVYEYVFLSAPYGSGAEPPEARWMQPRAIQPWQARMPAGIPDKASGLGRMRAASSFSWLSPRATSDQTDADKLTTISKRQQAELAPHALSVKRTFIGKQAHQFSIRDLPRLEVALCCRTEEIRCPITERKWCLPSTYTEP